jgi:CheY-like chemotaxis protein/two-component sensor histidine kinase
MSKIEAGKFDLTYAEFDFEHMLKNVTGMMSFRIDEKKQNFIVRIDEHVPARIVADEQRLAQVLTNLLSNAAKFTSEEGTIILSVENTGEKDGKATLTFHVIDSGIGITKEQMGRLFTLFEQADGTIARKFGGTGLGLAISRNIVELMGGRIWVESEPGKGSDFILEISVEKGRINTKSKKQNWENLRILAVDDSWDVLEYFKEFALQMKIQCETASSGEEAFALMEKTDPPFDLVFADWRMPGMNGIELTEKIKRRFGKKTVVIMISAAEWESIEKDAKKAGIDGFIAKPLFPSVLTDCINTHLFNPESTLMPENTSRNNIFAGKKLLLAEDVEINHEIVESLLEDTGITIEWARNGREAVNKYEKDPGKYNIILMDIHMPEMDGYEATRKIRISEAEKAGEFAQTEGSMQTPHIPIVAMTANVFREDIEHCLEAGMDDHMGKPINTEELYAKLKKYIH